MARFALEIGAGRVAHLRQRRHLGEQLRGGGEVGLEVVARAAAQAHPEARGAEAAARDARSAGARVAVTLPGGGSGVAGTDRGQRLDPVADRRRGLLFEAAQQRAVQLGAIHQLVV